MRANGLESGILLTYEYLLPTFETGSKPLLYRPKKTMRIGTGPLERSSHDSAEEGGSLRATKDDP